MAEQYLSKTVATRLKNLCISCDSPPAFGYSAQSGESSSTGKSNLALGNSTDTINATTIETINLIAQNAETQIINADVGQFYTLEVVEVRGFRATGDIDFNGANMVNINIDSGTLDNVVIGGDDPAAATFTDLQAIGASGFACFDWNSELDILSVCGAMFITGAINFGSSGTNIYGNGTDLFLTVTGTFYQNIREDSNITIRGDQFLSITGSQTETFGVNFTSTVGNNLTTNVENAYDINVGNTYSVDSFGPLSLTSNDDLNLHADGCLNISADCLNFTIGSTSNFIFGDTVNALYEKDYNVGVSQNKTISIGGNETKQIEGYLDYYTGSTGKLTFADQFNIDAQEDFIVDVHDCFVLTASCLDINIATSATVDIGDSLYTSITGSMNTTINQNENKTILQSYNLSIGATALIHTDDKLNITADNGFFLATSGAPIDITSQKCINITSEECINIDAGTTMTTTVQGEYLLSTSGDIKLHTESKAVRFLDGTCIYIGDDASICGSSGVISINSTSEILFNVNEVKIPDGGNLSVGCVYLGTTSVSICGNDTDLTIFTTGCLYEDIQKCVDISVGSSYNQHVATDYYLNVNNNQIIGVSGSSTKTVGTFYDLTVADDFTTNVDNHYDINVGNTYSVESFGQMSLTSNDDLNLHADGCLNITASCLNFDIGTTSSFNYGGDLSSTIVGNETKQITNNYNLTIENDKIIAVSGSNTTTIGTFYDLTVADNFITNVDNHYDINVGNTYSVESFGQMSLTSNDDLNLHADGCLNITASCLNFDISTTSSLTFGDTLTINGQFVVETTDTFMLTVGSTYELNTTNDASITSDTNINLNASECINLNAPCINIPGNLAISGTLTFPPDNLGSTYNLNTTNNISFNSQEDINLGASGYINLEAPYIAISGDTTFYGSVTLPAAVEQQWVNYGSFETIGTTQYVFVASDRDVDINGAGEYYWNFCNDKEESFYVSYDITQKILEAGIKGFKLTSIKPYYEILTNGLKSASVNIVKHSLENFDPSIGRTGTFLDYDETQLNDAIGITRYYPSIGVSGEFLKGHESIMVEFCFDKNATTDLHFYGMTIEFTTII